MGLYILLKGEYVALVARVTPHEKNLLLYILT